MLPPAQETQAQEKSAALPPCGCRKTCSESYNASPSVHGLFSVRHNSRQGWVGSASADGHDHQPVDAKYASASQDTMMPQTLDLLQKTDMVAEVEENPSGRRAEGSRPSSKLLKKIRKVLVQDSAADAGCITQGSQPAALKSWWKKLPFAAVSTENAQDDSQQRLPGRDLTPKASKSAANEPSGFSNTFSDFAEERPSRQARSCQLPSFLEQQVEAARCSREGPQLDSISIILPESGLAAGSKVASPARKEYHAAQQGLTSLFSICSPTEFQVFQDAALGGNHAADVPCVSGQQILADCVDESPTIGERVLSIVKQRSELLVAETRKSPCSSDKQRHLHTAPHSGTRATQQQQQKKKPQQPQQLQHQPCQQKQQHKQVQLQRQLSQQKQDQCQQQPKAMPASPGMLGMLASALDSKAAGTSFMLPTPLGSSSQEQTFRSSDFGCSSLQQQQQQGTGSTSRSSSITSSSALRRKALETAMCKASMEASAAAPACMHAESCRHVFSTMQTSHRAPCPTAVQTAFQASCPAAAMAHAFAAAGCAPGSGLLRPGQLLVSNASGKLVPVGFVLPSNHAAWSVPEPWVAIVGCMVAVFSGIFAMTFLLLGFVAGLQLRL